MRVLCRHPITGSRGGGDSVAGAMRPTLRGQSLGPTAPSVIQASDVSVEHSRFIGRGSRHRSYFLSIMPPSICNTWPVVYVLVIRKM
jgi:hypothetical protein